MPHGRVADSWCASTLRLLQCPQLQLARGPAERRPLESCHQSKGSRAFPGHSVQVHRMNGPAGTGCGGFLTHL
jgi:hypothetical protein